MRGRYQREKELAREKCINIQMWMAEQNLSYFELALVQKELARLAKRYGLTAELKENGLL